MSEPRVIHFLLIPASGVRVPVHEGEDEDEALARAVQEDPDLRARVERTNRQIAAGETIPAEDLYQELGLAPSGASTPPVSTRRGRLAADASDPLLVQLPKAMHRELAKRAEAEGTTINQLVLTYVSRGLAVEDARAG